MKTKINTLVFLLLFVTSAIFAGGLQDKTANEGSTTPDGTEFLLVRSEIIAHRLAPATPKVADFEDEVGSALVTVDLLAPATPKEPDFEEMTPIAQIPAASIAPHTPVEADFQE